MDNTSHELVLAQKTLTRKVQIGEEISLQKVSEFDPKPTRLDEGLRI